MVECVWQFTPATLTLDSGVTRPPPPLSEADLLSCMDKVSNINCDANKFLFLTFVYLKFHEFRKRFNDIDDLYALLISDRQALGQMRLCMIT